MSSRSPLATRRCGVTAPSSPSSDGETPQGAGRDRQLRRQSYGSDDDGGGSDLDASLAHAASSLEISCEATPQVGIQRSPNDMSSGATSSLSPARLGERCGQGTCSKRRSISDLSHSARMTPKSMEREGMGIPWERAPGLCSIDIRPGDTAERERQFCLMPTPELVQKASLVPRAPMTPERGSPGLMQRTFEDRVQRASMMRSPDSEGLPDGTVAGSPPFRGFSRPPEELRDLVSPISCMHESPTPGHPVSPEAAPCFSPAVRRLALDPCGPGGNVGEGPAPAHTGAPTPRALGGRVACPTPRAEERLQPPLLSCRVQPQILKARRAAGPAAAMTARVQNPLARSGGGGRVRAAVAAWGSTGGLHGAAAATGSTTAGPGMRPTSGGIGRGGARMPQAPRVAMQRGVQPLADTGALKENKRPPNAATVPIKKSHGSVAGVTVAPGCKRRC